MNGAGTLARVGLAVDLSAGRLRIGRSERLRRTLRHETLLDVSLDDAEAARARVAEWSPRARAGDAGGRAGGPEVIVTACLPVHECLTRWLRAPLASVAKAKKVLPSLLDIQLPFSIEDCVHLFPWIRRTAQGEVEALAVAARLSDVRRKLETLSALGVEPVILDHEGLAIWSQSLLEQPPCGPGRRVVAAVYPDHLALALGETGVGGQGNDRFIGAHSVRPVESLWQAAGQPSTDPTIQRVISRVRQILQSQASEAPSSVEWVWTGPGAEDVALLEELQHHLLELGDFSFLRHAEPAAFLQRALATRALLGGGWPCNFRTGPLTHPAIERQRLRESRRTSAAIAAAGLVLCGLGLAWPRVLETRKANVQAELETVAASLAPDVHLLYGQELRVTRQALQDRAGLSRPFLEAFEPSLASLLVETLQTARAQELALDFLDLSAGAVTLRGAAADWDRCERLAEPFRRRGLHVVVERQDAGLDEKVHFSLKGGRAP
ncbi:MAG: hypothetical protein KKC51_00135 [Verrucomicrobia bacterium]|nr:hypothetical protein [Verrucomicrobiota bacterium]